MPYYNCRLLNACRPISEMIGYKQQSPQLHQQRSSNGSSVVLTVDPEGFRDGQALKIDLNSISLFAKSFVQLSSCYLSDLYLRRRTYRPCRCCVSLYITEWSTKWEPVWFWPLTDLSNSFTIWKGKNFQNNHTSKYKKIKRLKHISPHLKYVATLPCEDSDTFNYVANLEENENRMHWFCMYRIAYNNSLVTYCWRAYHFILWFLLNILWNNRFLKFKQA